MSAIFVFGNEWIERDSAAYRLMGDLEKSGFDCVHIKDPQQLLPMLERGEKVTLLDVAEGIEEPVVVESLDQLEAGKVSTLHDFDLAFFLKLLKQLGTLDERQLRIVAVPAAEEVDAGVLAGMID